MNIKIVSEVSTKSDGNTKSDSEENGRNRCRIYAFTLNNYNDNDVIMLSQSQWISNNLNKNIECKKIVFQKEISKTGEILVHPIICYVTLDNTPSSLTLSARDAMESRNSAAKSWTPGQGSVTLYKNFSCRQFFGVKDPNDNVQLSAQTTSANIPLDGAFFSFSASPTHGSSIPATDFVVEVSYFIKLTEPRRPNAS